MRIGAHGMKLTLWACAALPMWCQAPQDMPTLHLTAQLVLVDASVVERRTGAPIIGLTPADFRLVEDGVEQPVSYVSEDRLPLSIAFLFDVTDTVRPILKRLAVGAREVLSRLRPEDEAAVLTFSNHVTLLQPFTQDRSLLSAAIANAADVRARNTPTFIHESVFAATEEAEKATIPNSRRVEVWLTDGTSNYTGLPKGIVSHRNTPDHIHTKEEATGRITRSSVVAAVLVERSALTDAAIPFMPLMGHLGEINRYADLTGGPVMHTGRADVSANLSALIDALRQRYTLGFKPAQSKPAGTICKLHLELSPAFFASHPEVAPRGVAIRTRQSYSR